MRRLVVLAPWLLVLLVAAGGGGAWTVVEPAKGPGPRIGHGIAATDAGFVVWGGCVAERLGWCREWLATGARFDPSGKGRWRPISEVGAPTPRDGAVVEAAGPVALVWGGKEPGIDGHPGTGAVYDPQRDVWSSMSTAGSPAARVGFASVWTGSGWFVWGGYHHVQVGTRVTGRYLGEGAVYDPAADRWQAVAAAGAPSPRRGATAAWTGDKVVVWGGCVETDALCAPTGTGAVWDPATDRWAPMAAEGAPVVAQHPTDVVFAGGRLLVFGFRAVKEGSSRKDPAVWAWDPAADRWSWRPAPRVVEGRAFPVGQEVLLVGADEAWLYDPADDRWSAVAEAPTRHPGVAMAFGGRKLLTWGGVWTERAGAAPARPHPIDSGLLLELF